MVNPNEITEHLEVVGSDGAHVGTVDKLAVKLTKKDPAAQGQHHVINLELVQAVEGGRVVLSVPAAEAMEEQKAIS